MDGTTITKYTGIRPLGLETHKSDFIFVAWERSEVSDDKEFEFFDRLEIPVGRYSLWTAGFFTYPKLDGNCF